MMMVQIDLNALNISKRRDPNGFYVAIIGEHSFALIVDYINDLGLDIEKEGNMIMIKTKSWAKLAKLIKKAESNIKILITP
jgi:arginine repressor